MKGFDRYVFKQLAIGLVFVTAGMTAMIWLTQSLRFVEMIVNRGLSAGTFAYLTMLLLPNFLSIILPIALCSVVIFVYARMINDRELVIMRAAGQGQTAIARPALILALIVVGIGYLLNIYLLPNSYRMFRELQWDIRYNYSHLLLRDGAFNIINKDTTIYIRERTQNGELLGILAHITIRKDRPVTYMAERGALVKTPTAPRVIMYNGTRQEVDKKTGKLSLLYFDKFVHDFKATGTTGLVRYREARERSIGELLNLDPKGVDMDKDYKKFTVEAHKRLINPLYSLGLTLIGLACLISGGFTRRMQIRRVVLATVIIVTTQLVALGLENISARNLAMIPLMYIFAFGVIAVAAGYMFRPSWKRAGKVKRPTVARSA